jgi:hypothetical protein
MGLTMADEDVVRRFAEIVGCGTVAPRSPRKAHWKPQWQWTVCNVAETVVLSEMFRPYLGKRRTARLDEILAEVQATGAGANRYLGKRCWDLYGKRYRDLTDEERRRYHREHQRELTGSDPEWYKRSRCWELFGKRYRDLTDEEHRQYHALRSREALDRRRRRKVEQMD